MCFVILPRKLQAFNAVTKTPVKIPLKQLPNVMHDLKHDHQLNKLGINDISLPNEKHYIVHINGLDVNYQLDIVKPTKSITTKFIALFDFPSHKPFGTLVGDPYATATIYNMFDQSGYDVLDEKYDPDNTMIDVISRKYVEANQVVEYGHWIIEAKITFEA